MPFPTQALRFNNSGIMVVQKPLGADVSISSVTVEAWLRIHKHKSHNWVVGTISRQAGWAMFIDGSARVSYVACKNSALVDV